MGKRIQEVIAKRRELGLAHTESVRAYPEEYPQAQQGSVVIVERECVECGASFMPTRATQKYCSVKCGNIFRVRAWRRSKQGSKEPVTCACGVKFVRKRKDQIFCSERCSARHRQKVWRDKHNS